MNRFELFLWNLAFTGIGACGMLMLLSIGLPEVDIVFVIALTLLYWFSMAVKETDKDILEKRIKDLEEKIGK